MDLAVDCACGISVNVVFVEPIMEKNLPQNQKCIMYSIVMRGGLSHMQKIL